MLPFLQKLLTPVTSCSIAERREHDKKYDLSWHQCPACGKCFGLRAATKASDDYREMIAKIQEENPLLEVLLSRYPNDWPVQCEQCGHHCKFNFISRQLKAINTAHEISPVQVYGGMRFDPEFKIEMMNYFHRVFLGWLAAEIQAGRVPASRALADMSPIDLTQNRDLFDQFLNERNQCAAWQQFEAAHGRIEVLTYGQE